MTTPLQPGEHPSLIFSHAPSGGSGRFNSALNDIDGYLADKTNFDTYFDLGEDGYAYACILTPTGNPGYDESGRQPPMSYSSLRFKDPENSMIDHYWRRAGLARSVNSFKPTTPVWFYARAGQNDPNDSESGFVPNPELTIMPVGNEYWFDPNDTVTTNVIDKFWGPFEALAGAFDYGADGGGDNESEGINEQILTRSELVQDWNDDWVPQGRVMYLEAFARDGSDFESAFALEPQIGLTTYIGNISREGFSDVYPRGGNKHVWIERTWAASNTNQITDIEKNGATGGTFVLTVNGNDTNPISISADIDTVVAEIEAADPTATIYPADDGQDTTYTNNLSTGWRVHFITSGDSGAVTLAVDDASVTGGTGMTIETWQPAQTVQASGEDEGLTTHRADLLRKWDKNGFILSTFGGTAAETLDVINWVSDLHKRISVRKQCGAFVWDATTFKGIAIRIHKPGGFTGAPAFTTGVFTGTTPTGFIYVDGVLLDKTDILAENVGVFLDDGQSDGECYWHYMAIDAAALTGTEEVRIEAPIGTYTQATDGDSRAFSVYADWLDESLEVLSLPNTSGTQRGYVAVDSTVRKTGYVVNIGSPTIGASDITAFQVRNEGGQDLTIISNEIGGRAENVSRWTAVSKAATTAAAYNGVTVGTRNANISIVPDGRSVHETYCITTDCPICPVHLYYLRSNYPGYFRLWNDQTWSDDTEVISGDSIDAGTIHIGVPRNIWLYGWNEGDNDLASLAATTLPSSITMKVYGIASGEWTEVDDFDDLDALEPFDAFAVKLMISPTSPGAYDENVVFNHGGNQSNGSGGVNTGGAFTVNLTGSVMRKRKYSLVSILRALRII